MLDIGAKIGVAHVESSKHSALTRQSSGDRSSSSNLRRRVIGLRYRALRRGGKKHMECHEEVAAPHGASAMISSNLATDSEGERVSECEPHLLLSPSPSHLPPRALASGRLLGNGAIS